MSAVTGENVAELGICALCGQDMIRDGDDCWHPHDVEVACPPEPGLWTDKTHDAWQAFYSSGWRPGRPGREHWRPKP